MGKQWKWWQTFFSWAPKLLQMVTAAMKLKDACSFYFRSNNLKCYDQPRQHIKKQRPLLTKVHLVNGFSSSQAWMWELDYKESWALKNWFFWTVVLEKTLESPLDCKEIKPANPKGNQFWIFIEMTNVEAEAPILWPPDAKNWLIGKDSDVGQDWRQEKGTTEDEKVGWHHWLNRHEFEQALGIGDRQGSLACCSPWGHKESDTTEWLNWTDIYNTEFLITQRKYISKRIKHEIDKTSSELILRFHKRVYISKTSNNTTILIKAESALSIKYKQNHDLAQLLPFAKYLHVPYLIWSLLQSYELNKAGIVIFLLQLKTLRQRSCDLPESCTRLVQDLLLYSRRAAGSGSVLKPPWPQGDHLYYKTWWFICQ